MTFFSDQHRQAQERYRGRAVADRLLEHRVSDKIDANAKQLIESSLYFFIASGSGSQIDCSIKCGDPGFVRVLSERKLCWPDFDGNRMYRTIGNITGNPQVSLLFVNFTDPASNRSPSQISKLRVTGRARVLEEGKGVEAVYGAKRIIEVDVEFCFPNCPRYLPAMEFKSKSIYTPREGEETPTPEWKTRDYIVEVLDEQD